MPPNVKKIILFLCFIAIAGCTISDYNADLRKWATPLAESLLDEAEAAEITRPQIKGNVEKEFGLDEFTLLYTPYREAYDKETLGRSFAQSVSIAAYGAKWRLGMNGLPRNVRQVDEGYWLGAYPTVEQLGELQARGVKFIVSATHLDNVQVKSLRQASEKLGMVHINVPFGGKFPRRSHFWEDFADCDPSQVYIHCEYGGDRTGALLAFLLATKHGWTVERAFLAVAFPGKKDTRELIAVLENRGYKVAESDVEQYLGIYSPESNGGFGGLKVRSRDYLKLINTTIDAIQRINKKKLKV